MTLEKANLDVWMVYYKLSNEPEIYTEVTSDLVGTRARLEVAGFIIIDEIVCG